MDATISSGGNNLTFLSICNENAMIRKGLKATAICKTCINNSRRLSCASELATMKRKRIFGLLLVLVTIARTSSQDVKFSVCDRCKCSNAESLDPEAEPYLRIDCVPGKSVESFSLDSLKWPNSKDNVVVSARGFNMSSAQKLPKNEYIVSISLNYNNIRTTWPKVFEEVPNLKMLSLANNDLEKVSQDLFVNLKLLKHLDFSDNKLSDFNKLDFQDLKSLETLIMNGNKIDHVPVNALNGIPSLEKLYLSRNQIFLLKFEEDSESWQKVEKIKVLDFSFNKLTVITKETFQRNQKLEYLNLSNNNIKNIEADSFANCKALQTIDISSNEIKSLSTFPPFVKTALLNKNMLNEWPQFPDSLKILDISENDILTIYNEDEVNFESIEVLNVSRNSLQNFDISRPLPNLTILDISYNNMETFPKNFDSSLFPSIEDLSIDGNPIKELVFENTLYLKRFSANHLKRITEIKKSNLKLKGKISPENTEECINVHISHCENLKNVESNAFDDLPLCHLDLSFNNLKTLSRNEKFKNIGVNLQGNPWSCTCEMQWILDDLLEELYEKHPLYLHELRCEAPRNFQGLRFVHFYQWGERAFCEDAKKARKSANYMIGESTDSSSNEDMLVILLFVAIVVLAIVVGALVAYLLKGRWRQKQRMQQRNRKRAADSKHAVLQNGETNALTTV